MKYLYKYIQFKTEEFKEKQSDIYIYPFQFIYRNTKHSSKNIYQQVSYFLQLRRKVHRIADTALFIVFLGGI